MALPGGRTMAAESGAGKSSACALGPQLGQCLRTGPARPWESGPRALPLQPASPEGPSPGGVSAPHAAALALSFDTEPLQHAEQALGLLFIHWKLRNSREVIVSYNEKDSHAAKPCPNHHHVLLLGRLRLFRFARREVGM